MFLYLLILNCSSSVKCTILTQQLGSGTGELPVAWYSRLRKQAKSCPVLTLCNKAQKLCLFYHLTDRACVILVVQLFGTILKCAVPFSHSENRSLGFKSVSVLRCQSAFLIVAST